MRSEELLRNSSCDNAKLDEDILRASTKGFCHPDAPTEFVIISKEPLPPYRLEGKGLIRRLYKGQNNSGHGKEPIITVINGREVELFIDPVLEGRLMVIIRRAPKNTMLTFKEACEILSEIDSLLGINMSWSKPFPRGSC